LSHHLQSDAVDLSEEYFHAWLSGVAWDIDLGDPRPAGRPGSVRVFDPGNSVTGTMLWRMGIRDQPVC